MSKHLWLVLICLLWSINAKAQTLQGQILDASTKKPLLGVQISSEKSTKKAFSDAEGKFSFTAEGFPLELFFQLPQYRLKKVIFEDPSSSIEVQLIPEEEMLSEVILNSTLFPQKMANTPAAVSLLTRQELERFDGTNILQAFTTVPGITVHQGALNTNKMSIRGVGSRAQYSSNRVKAYFMEIPISTAEGETTLDDLDVSTLEKVEIIKGPVSSMYGAGLGGTITLMPLQNKKSGSFAATKTTFGSYGLLKNNLQAAITGENSNLVATYNHLESDGWRENGAYNRNSFTLFGKVAETEKNSLWVLGQILRLKAFIPSSLSEDVLEKNPSSAASSWAAAKGFESYDKGLMGISFQQKFTSKFENTSSLHLNFRKGYEPRPFDILKEEQIATGARTKFSLKNALFDTSNLVFGAEVYREWYDTGTFENLYKQQPGEGSLRGKALSYNEQDRNYFNVFAQFHVELMPKLQLEAGVNYNNTSYQLTDLYAEDEIDQSGKYRFKPIFSPRLGAVYAFAPGKNIYASVSHGFSTPTVAETLTPEGVINTDLKPETGINYELGFKGNFLRNHLYAEIAAFSIQVQDLLVAERVAEDQYIGRNAGKTNHNGLEMLFRYNVEISSKLRAQAFLSAAFNAFKFDEFIDSETDFSGNYLPAVPDKSINGGLDVWLAETFSFKMTYQHEGKMPLNDANSAFSNSYNLLHLKTSWSPQLFKRWETEIFAGINNVFDEKYAASIIPNAVGFGNSQPRYFYPGTPRNYFAGLALKYFL